MKKNNTWNISHLVDESSDPAYYLEDCRILSDMICDKNSSLLFLFWGGQKTFLLAQKICWTNKSVSLSGSPLKKQKQTSDEFTSQIMSLIFVTD